MVEMVGVSRCQGACPLRGANASLTAVFRVSYHLTPGYEPTLLSWTWIRPRSYSTNENGPSRVLFIGGDGGSRTHVQEYFRRTFSERSRLLLFRSPLASTANLGIAIPWILLRYRELTQEIPACMTPDSQAAGDLRPTRGAELCSQCEVVVCFSVSS